MHAVDDVFERKVLDDARGLFRMLALETYLHANIYGKIGIVAAHAFPGLEVQLEVGQVAVPMPDVDMIGDDESAQPATANDVRYALRLVRARVGGVGREPAVYMAVDPVKIGVMR